MTHRKYIYNIILIDLPLRISKSVILSLSINLTLSRIPLQGNDCLCIFAHVRLQVLTSHFGQVYFALTAAQTSHVSHLRSLNK